MLVGTGAALAKPAAAAYSEEAVSPFQGYPAPLFPLPGVHQEQIPPFQLLDLAETAQVDQKIKIKYGKLGGKA